MDLVSSTDLKLLESVGATIEQLKEDDLEEWFDHVALVFSKTGRGYFVDHYNAQPTLKYILVAKSAETGHIISTMRIFEHHIVIGVRTPVQFAVSKCPCFSDSLFNVVDRQSSFDVQVLARYPLIQTGGVKALQEFCCAPCNA